MPTGGRQTSWLFTSVAEKLNSGLPRTISLAVRTGFEPATYGWNENRPRRSFLYRCRATPSSPVFHLVVVQSSLSTSASIDLDPHWVTFALRCPAKGMPGRINKSLSQCVTKPAPFGRVTIKVPSKAALPNTPFPTFFLHLFQNEAWCTTFHMGMSLICKTVSEHEKLIFI